MSYIQLQTKDIQRVRKELLEKQNYICPITKQQLTLEDSALDHCHKPSKDYEIGLNNAGLCRGVLNKQVNMWEGKISNSFKRLGLHKYELDMPEMLRNLADYLEQEATNYIHPNEQEKPKKITKTCYGKLVKKLNEVGYKNKIPEYPKSQMLTKALSELFKKYEVEVEYYK